MKRSLFYALAATLTLSFAACKNKTSAETAATSDTTVIVADSQQVVQEKNQQLVLKQFTKKTKKNDKETAASYEFAAEILIAQSETNPILAHAINEWVNEQLGGEYEGEVSDGEAMLSFYQKLWLGDKGDVIELGDNTISIKKVYETDKFITLEASTYWYSGGAHGGASLIGATFRKSDGRKFDKSMIANEQELRPLLEKGLIKAFDVKNREELGDALMLSTASGDDDAETKLIYLSLPETQPWLTKEGMQLVYQQYEIGPYAVGMPTVAVPYSKLKPLLNATGKAYLK